MGTSGARIECKRGKMPAAGSCPRRQTSSHRASWTSARWESTVLTGSSTLTFTPVGPRVCYVQRICFAALFLPLLPPRLSLSLSFSFSFSLFLSIYFPASKVAFARYGDGALWRFHAGRCVLLGDASHAMSPQLGQGANLGTHAQRAHA